jgi:hypothetical protein
MKIHFALPLLVAMSVPLWGQNLNTPRPPDKIDPNLPNVLILGDSISMGYTPVVKRLLAGKANVQRPIDNCNDTGAGLRNIDRWLGTQKWAVIQFNWGLHDFCYRDPYAAKADAHDKVHGVITVPPDQYEKNLELLVTRLEKTGAKLVWASTTVVPEGDSGRFVGDDKKYNDIAARVMQRHGIPTDDLYALTVSFHGAFSAGPGNVHYNNAGYTAIGRQVAGAVEKALAAANSANPG